MVKESKKGGIMKTYKIFQDLGIMGIFGICEWKSENSTTALREFLQANPNFQNGKKGLIKVGILTREVK